MEANHYFSIVFKYGGYWVSTEKQLTRKYEGARQKTVKIHKDLISFSYLQEEILKIFPWVVRNSFDLHYHVLRTSPKEYKLITTEDDSREMVVKFERVDGAVNLEMIISTPPATEGIIQVHEFETNNDDHLVEGINDILLEELCEDEQAFIVGTHFEDSTSFKNALRSYSITNNFGMKLKKSDRKRVVGVCSYRGCPWRVRASVCADGHTFEIRKIDGSHSCPGVNRAGNKQATTTWIASQIQDLVKKEPDIAPKQIRNNLENTFGLALPYMKLWRSREIAKELIFGSEDANYSWVPTLRSELVKRNPGSHIIYKYDEKDNSFQRFFISFKASIEGFLAGCRPLIGVDACHLKSKYLGVLLSANALDGNNDLFTLAFAVVETESKQTWEWFLENLLLSIGFQLHPLSFVSDMEKSLAEALTNLFPDAEHRVCLRHLWKNLKRFFKCPEGHQIQTLVWSAANTLMYWEFLNKMEEIKAISNPIYSYLFGLRYKWSRCQFSCDIKNISNTNNMSESFNAWIAEVRNKPVVDLVDLLRGKLMTLRAKRWGISTSWCKEVVPYAEDYICSLTRRKDQFFIRPCTNSKAEIESKKDRHEVDIDSHECTCLNWQMTGLPYIHAVAFIGLKENPMWHMYIDQYYHVSRFRMAYAAPIATS